MRVTGLMPVKGRLEQTMELIPRLFATVGNLGNARFDLVVIADDDKPIFDAVKAANFPNVTLVSNVPRKGYWNSLAEGAKHTDAPMLINLANDLIPGREWLSRGLKCYQKASSELGRSVMVGFNDGVHPGNHAGHIMVPRKMLEGWYGDTLFPTMYDHLHADVELVLRAMEQGAFVYSIYAWLFHNHIVNGKPFDPVYSLGHARQHEDYQTFQRRHANGWR